MFDKVVNIPQIFENVNLNDDTFNGFDLLPQTRDYFGVKGVCKVYLVGQIVNRVDKD